MPAGPLPNSKFIKYAFERGFDVLVYKTQRTVAVKANQFPNIVYLEIEGDLTLDKAVKPVVGHPITHKSPIEYSITNSFGNPSRGPSYWVKDLKEAHTYQAPGQLLIASVVGTIQAGFSDEDYYDDFARAAEMAASSGVEAIEINLSCPNVASEGILCYTPSAVLATTKKVKAKIGALPLIVKFGYFSPEQEDLLVKIVKDIAPYIAAISAINTIPAPIVNEKGDPALPGPNRLIAGVCGASIKWAGLDMVKRLNDIRKKLSLDYEIVGVGGVMTPADFKEYRVAGADLVQSATGAMWNPKLAAQIKEILK